MLKETDKPSYYSVTPAAVRYDDRLSDGAIKIYGEISALTNKFGYCSASNGYFSKLYKKNDRTISRLISELVDNGHLKRKMIDRKTRHLYLSTVY